MNRRQLITIILVLAAVSAYAQQDNYTISGDLSPMVGILVKDTTDIDSVFVVNDANHRAGIEQKCAVEDGKFFLTGHVDKPQYTEMKLPNMPAAHLPNSECSLFLCHWLREYIKTK